MKYTNRERLNSLKMKINAVGYLAENNESSRELFAMIMRFLNEIEEESRDLVRIVEREGEFNLDTETED